MVFSPVEAEHWLAEHLYPAAGIEPETIDIAKLRQAEEVLIYPVGGTRPFCCAKDAQTKRCCTT